MPFYCYNSCILYNNNNNNVGFYKAHNNRVYTKYTHNLVALYNDLDRWTWIHGKLKTLRTVIL